MINPDSSLTTFVTTIAHQAGDCIMSHYKRPIAVKNKEDSSPVTEADRRAEDIIAAALIAFDPGIPLIAEERFATSNGSDHGAESFWLVDPLDGTKEFLSQNGEFTVNIALIENGHPVVGVVHAPALQVTYSGSRDSGAFVSRNNNDPEPIYTRTQPEQGVSVVASRSHNDSDAMERFLGNRNIAEVKAVGSSLKFCLVACGEADLYPRLGPTMEWDTAAGHAVLLAAGGTVVEAASGHPLTYGKPGFANPHFVAYGCKS